MQAIINHIENENTPIPKKLMYKGFERHIDNEGRSLAMMWIKYRNTDIPLYLRYL